MRLPRPLRTSSFRLTILYAAMFGLSGLLLFATVAWSVSSFMAEQLDATVANELAEVQADAGGQDIGALKRVIDGLIVNSPGIYYLLQTSGGRVVAGNMMAIHPTAGAALLDMVAPGCGPAGGRRHSRPRHRVAGWRLPVCRNERPPAWRGAGGRDPNVPVRAVRHAGPGGGRRADHELSACCAGWRR